MRFFETDRSPADRPLCGIHPGEDTLESYAMGKLPGWELAETEEHLLIRPVCQQELAETDAFLKEIDKARARAGQPRRGADTLRTPVRMERG